MFLLGVPFSYPKGVQCIYIKENAIILPDILEENDQPIPSKTQADDGSSCSLVFPPVEVTSEFWRMFETMRFLSPEV